MHQTHSAEGTCCPVCGANEWNSWLYDCNTWWWIDQQGECPWFETLINRSREQYVFIDICAKCGTVVS